MSGLTLNFTRQAEKRRRQRELAVLLLSLLMLAFIGRETVLLKQQPHENVPTMNAEQQQIRVLTEQDKQAQQLALSVAEALNTPWLEMLAALEDVKQQHPDVYVKTILPDARKGEIFISGEVKKLGDFLRYLDALNAQTMFTDSLPISQQQLIPVSDGMAFSLKLEWRYE